MTEPIKLPYPWKYLEELPVLRFWFIYGMSVDGTHVDITDGVQDVFVGLPLNAAETIVEARLRYLEVVSDVNWALGDNKCPASESENSSS